MWRRPVLIINNSGGNNILPALKGRWKYCSVVDKAGRESDEAEIVCIGPPSSMPLPKKGDKFTILMGWSDTGRSCRASIPFRRSASADLRTEAN